MVNTRVITVHENHLSLVDATVKIVGEGERKSEEWQFLDQRIRVPVPGELFRETGGRHGFYHKVTDPTGGTKEIWMNCYLPKGRLDNLGNLFRWAHETQPEWAHCFIFDSVLEGVATLDCEIRPHGGSSLAHEALGCDLKAAEKLNLVISERSCRLFGPDGPQYFEAVLTDGYELESPNAQVRIQVLVEAHMQDPVVDVKHIRHAESFGRARAGRCWPIGRIEFGGRATYDSPKTETYLRFPTWYRCPPDGSWEEIRLVEPSLGSLLDGLGWLGNYRVMRSYINSSQIWRERPGIDVPLARDITADAYVDYLYQRQKDIADLATFLEYYCRARRTCPLEDGKHVVLLREKWTTSKNDPLSEVVIGEIQQGELVSLKRGGKLNGPNGPMPFREQGYVWVLSQNPLIPRQP